METMAYREQTPVRDVNWCEAEIRAGRPIAGERIHLSRPIGDVGPSSITLCFITTDAGGVTFVPPDEAPTDARLAEIEARLAWLEQTR